MKKRFLALCAIVSMSAMLVACGESKEVATEDVQTEESVEDTTASSESEDSEGSEEGKYVVFTNASDEEVEAYADKVIKAALAKDWDTIGDMIQYPIGSKEDNNLCKDKDEFLAYANGSGFDEEYFTSLSKWDSSELWGNWQGACIDNGNIWFRDINLDTPEFKIVSFFGLAEGSVEE